MPPASPSPPSLHPASSPSPPPSEIRGEHKKKKPRALPLKAFHALPPARDWGDLPVDALLYVMDKIDQVELVLGGAAGVCRAWRRVATQEPVLWRHIDMRGYGELSFRSDVDLHEVARTAVRRSAGQCHAFWTECAGDDDFLLFLAEQAPLLKSLRLISCFDVTREGFIAMIKKFPLLEELELSLCSNFTDQNVFEVIAKSCPRLKHFLHIERRNHYESDHNSWNGIAIAIAGMRGLCSLELHGNNFLDNQGLIAIVDNCPNLELLIIRDCPNVIMDKTLFAKCARIDIAMLRGDEYDHYQFFSTARSWSWSWSCSCWGCGFCSSGDYEYLGDGFFVEDLDDYNDYSRYLNGEYVTDLDDEEHRKMLAKCARRYLKISTDEV